MESVPFGISRLDTFIGGGAPSGSLVLLSGESGAGAREFLYTSAAMNSLASVDPELFDLHYGDLNEAAVVPPEVHYLSFTADERVLTREMSFTMDDEIVDAIVDHVTFVDLSPEYFQTSPVPREWYLGQTTGLEDLGSRHDREELLPAFGSYLSAHAPGNLVLVDSVTDLVAAISEEMTWNDITIVLKGLKKAAHQWGGLILLLVNRETLSDQQLGLLKDATDGTFLFEWESGGSKRARTMVVQEFRGVLSQLEEENIVRFETEIHEGGYDISDVRKIR